MTVWAIWLLPISWLAANPNEDEPFLDPAELASMAFPAPLQRHGVAGAMGGLMRFLDRLGFLPNSARNTLASSVGSRDASVSNWRAGRPALGTELCKAEFNKNIDSDQRRVDPAAICYRT
jgi:hypothetical protein